MFVYKIICDEFQDSNPALVGWLRKQQAYGKQIIGVGDPLQSIYGFRKARDALSDKVFPGIASGMSVTTLTLSQSFRFGEEIAELTNAIARASGSSFVLRGTPEITGSVGPGNLPSAYICATNAQCLDIAIGSMNTSSPVYFRGDKKSMVGLLKGIDQLNAGSISGHHLLVNFRTLSEMIEHAEMADPELKRIYDIYTKLGLSEATELVESLTREKRDQLPPGSRVAVTAHTAKGQEYESTCLVGFKEPRANIENTGDQSWNVIYVAASRAMKHADVVSDLDSSWLDELYEKHLRSIGKARPACAVYTPEIASPRAPVRDQRRHSEDGCNTVEDSCVILQSHKDLQEPPGFMDDVYKGYGASYEATHRTGRHLLRKHLLRKHLLRKHLLRKHLLRKHLLRKHCLKMVRYSQRFWYRFILTHLKKRWRALRQMRPIRMKMVAVRFWCLLDLI